MAAVVALSALLAHAGGVVAIVLVIGMAAFFALVWLHTRRAPDDVDAEPAPEAPDN